MTQERVRCVVPLSLAGSGMGVSPLSGSYSNCGRMPVNALETADGENSEVERTALVAFSGDVGDENVASPEHSPHCQTNLSRKRPGHNSTRWPVAAAS